MHRRSFIGLAGGALCGLAGCTARALPVPGLPGDRDDDTDCPRLLDVDRRVCPATEGGPLDVERSAGTVSGDDWSLLVTVTNRTDAPVGLNPYAWSVHRRDGDGWERVAPDAHIEPWIELAPEAAYTWQLAAAEEGLVDADQRVFLALSPGTYAFAIAVQGATPLGAIATFEVAG